MSRKPTSVMGVDAPGPMPTGRALWVVLRYVGLPLIGALLAVDVAVWLLAEAIWGVCIGIWCWF